MPQVEVKDLKNKVVGKLDLSEEVFAYEASEALVWEAVNAYRAAQRKGTHATKNRAKVRGGGRKPWRQKGTGRARVGTIRSPLWAGGGTVHGPQPRDYRQALPKKKRRGAVKLVLTDKLKNDRLIVVEEFELDSHKTKDFAGVLEALGINGKALIADAPGNRNLLLSARNLPGVKPVTAAGVNVYDLLNHDHLVISREAVLALQEALTK
jgi:large subunit ribosomal protein L4